MLTTKSIREEGGFVINGSKCFSTFGARDGYTMLFARDQDDNCSAFVARKNVKGYTISKMWDLMGGGGIEAVDVHYENVRLPLQNLLGREGKGMDVLLYWISIEKIQQCAACVGMAQAALDESIKFTRSRMNRGKPIADMQGIRWMLAEMHAGIQAARWMTYRAAFLKDRGDQTWMREAAAAKIMVVPATMEVVELARRLHGAYGYTGEFKIERLYRAIAGASAIAVSLEINKSQVAAELLNTAAGS